MIRFGLCCIFREEPIRFRRTTAKYLQTLSRTDQLQYLSDICRHNARSLMAALRYCSRNGIRDFRINSQILPVKTHPAVGYDVGELPDGVAIIEEFIACGKYCRENDMRTTFHPDQFILLSSPKREVVKRSVADLQYHAQVAEWVEADVINIHAGGAYGDKKKTLKRLRKHIDRLPDAVRSRLTLENDDRTYSPRDLLPLCCELEMPMVFDVHHHRCLPDGASVEETTGKAIGTWNREPLFHVSSPAGGWDSATPRHHSDFIDPRDFPACWVDLEITVEIEAKAKELAVLKLKREIERVKG
jgi:UV DNA damage endonuclease